MHRPFCIGGSGRASVFCEGFRLVAISAALHHRGTRTHLGVGRRFAVVVRAQDVRMYDGMTCSAVEGSNSAREYSIGGSG